jgi:hypothetical protein
MRLESELAKISRMVSDQNVNSDLETELDLQYMQTIYFDVFCRKASPYVYKGLPVSLTPIYIPLLVVRIFAEVKENDAKNRLQEYLNV